MHINFDSSFKPVDLRFVVAPLKEDFELLFCKTFSRKQNIKFLSHLQVILDKDHSIKHKRDLLGKLSISYRTIERCLKIHFID